MIKLISQPNCGRFFSSSFHLPCRLKLLMLFVLALTIPAPVGKTVSATAGSYGEALYFSFAPAPNSTLPASPSSLLIQSPSYIDVPAGAVLSVHLMRNETVIASSTLTFQNAYLNAQLVPAMPVASFVPSGTPPAGGSSLPGAILVPGLTDLTKVAMEPSQYRLLWMLSAGIMGTPGLAVATGVPVSFVDLKLSAVSAATIVGDQKPGSVLFFNRYTSSASNTLREDSTLNLTNTNPAAAAYVRLFLVTAATCQPTELQFCLAPQQTVSLLMSDLDPGVRGYAIAIATNLQGEPIQFNWLTGNAILRQPAGNISGSYNSLLNAVAIAKRKDGNVANTNGLAEMVFDDVVYDRLPGQIAFDSVPQSGQRRQCHDPFTLPPARGFIRLAVEHQRADHRIWPEQRRECDLLNRQSFVGVLQRCDDGDVPFAACSHQSIAAFGRDRLVLGFVERFAAPDGRAIQLRRIQQRQQCPPLELFR